MSLWKDFKSFAMHGNIMDIAVGMIIGAAFGNVVSSFVSDILMPPIGFLIGGIDFHKLHIALNKDTSINYGKFIQTLINFLIISFSVFILIRLWTALKRKDKVEKASVPVKTEESVLLSEIRDILKSK
ncbi:MAG: large-conductance mechanosensitive channel protein MscL [Cytophagaceae bacterium]